jgi:hypothetical protein
MGIEWTKSESEGAKQRDELFQTCEAAGVKLKPTMSTLLGRVATCNLAE